MKAHKATPVAEEDMSVWTHTLGGLILSSALAAADPQVVVWGRETYPGDETAFTGYHYVKDVPTDLGDVVDIAAGYKFMLALRSDGTVRAWGDNTYQQCAVPTGLADVVAISAGAIHSLALCRNGRVVAWGGNNFGQIAVPADLPPVLAISAKLRSSGALDSTGRVWYWGGGAAGLPATPTTDWRACAVGSVDENSEMYGCAIGRLADGTPVVWCTSGDNGWERDQIRNLPTGLATTDSMAMGYGWAVGVNSADGAAVAWGYPASVDACAGQINLCQVDLAMSIQVGRTRALNVVAWPVSAVDDWVGLQPPNGLTQVQDVAAGLYFGAALVMTTPPVPRVVWVAKPTDAQSAQTVLGHILVTGDEGNSSPVSLAPGGIDNRAIILDQHRILAGEGYGSQNQRSFGLQSVDPLGQVAMTVIQSVRQTTLFPNWVRDGSVAGTVAGQLMIDGASPPVGTTFTLVSGDGADDNSDFIVVDRSLVTTSSLKLSEGTYRRIRMRTDLVGGQSTEDVIDVAVRASDGGSGASDSDSGCGIGVVGLLLLAVLNLRKRQVL